MSIHHKTQEKAEGRSISLNQSGPEDYQAEWEGPDGVYNESRGSAAAALKAVIKIQDDFQAACETEEELDALNVFIFGEPEEEPTGSIVPERYKAEYQARGDVRGNCDPFFWWMKAEVLDGDGKLNMHQLEALASANELNLGKYQKLNNGQQRMVIGNILRNRIIGGVLVYDSAGKPLMEAGTDKEWQQWINECQARKEERKNDG